MEITQEVPEIKEERVEPTICVMCRNPNPLFQKTESGEGLCKLHWQINEFIKSSK